MEHERFVMEFDLPASGTIDFDHKIKEDGVNGDQKPGITLNHVSSVAQRDSRRIYDSPNPAKLEDKELQANKVSNLDKVGFAVTPNQPILRDDIRQSCTPDRSTRNCEAIVSNSELTGKFTMRDLYGITNERGFIAKELSLAVMNDRDRCKLPPSPTLTPTPGAVDTAESDDDQNSPQSPSQPLRTTREVLYLSRLRIQLNKINEEHETEQVQLNKIAGDLDDIKHLSRANQKEIDDSQAQVRNCKAEVAQAHAKWKQAQAKFKLAKDSSLHLSGKSLQLIKDRAEKADQHEEILNSITSLIERTNQLKHKINVTKELAAISKDFADEETKEFVKRMRNLPKLRIKTEKIDTKDRKVASDNEITVSFSDSNARASSDEDESIDWHNLGNDNTTFSEINYLRDRLNLIRCETSSKYIGDKPNRETSNAVESESESESATPVKVKSELQESSMLPGQQGKLRSPVSLSPSGMSLSDIRTHLDRIVYHKEQLDMCLDVARGPKRKVEEMERENRDDEDIDKDTSSDSSESSITIARRARKQRVVKKSVDYLERWR